MFIEQPFPDSEWETEFTDQIDGTHSWLPLNWQSLVSISAPRPIGQGVELALVGSAIANRSSHDVAAIFQQKYSYVPDLWRAMGKTSAVHPDFERLCEELISFAMIPIMALKQRFARGRTWHYDYPGTNHFWCFKVGHPAYPSGHATCAFLIASVLSEVSPAHAISVLDCATAIAKNREIAGVHFPSDTLAGSELADLLFTNILQMQNSTFGKWRDERVAAFIHAL